VIAIRELFRPLFWTNLDKASADYFLEFKYGNDQALLDDHLATLGSVEKLNKKAEVAREKLKTLDRLLAEAPNGGPFILGTKPSHADASLWGWYAASQVNAPVINELLWEHPSLPNVAKWVAAAKEATGIKFNFPPAKITPK
jgi:glutathione S-transferase